jgi:hypothetical protein
MSEALVQGIACRVDDVGRSIEVRFSNLEMNDAPALCLQRPRLRLYFESGLRTETRHALRETKVTGFLHGTDYARTKSSLNHQYSTFRPEPLSAPNTAGLVCGHERFW